MHDYELKFHPTADELSRAAAADWIGEIKAANGVGRPHAVALSGGRITLKLFAAAIKSVRLAGVSLANVHFFWADERCVPPDDSESNFAAANKHFFQPLGLAVENIHRIQGELAPDEGAKAATLEIQRFAPANESGQPMLDLIFLGMGEDGHVASLFPGEPEEARLDPAVYRAISNSPKPPPHRVTLGYGTIAAAKRLWVLASGAGKEAALQESLKPDGQTPLAQVLRMRLQTRIFTDIRLN
jgi:6-phosphogluconolactonase